MQPDPIPLRRQPDPDALSPWQEPARGDYPGPEAFRGAAADMLSAMIAGTAPQPPISRLTGMRLIECGIGTAAFSMPLSDWLCTSQGAISIGPLTMPADAAMACAIQTELPPATPLTTAELSLRLLRPAPTGGSITARGRIVDVRRTLALAEVTVIDRDEHLIAHGSSLCVLQPEADRIAPDREGATGDTSDATPRTPEAAAPAAPTTDTATAPAAERSAASGDTRDPWERPPMGEILPQDVWERMTGLEVLAAQLRGELPGPPIHHLTGLSVVEVAERQATFAMPASEWLCAPIRARVQGGAVALLAEAGCSGAIQTIVPARTALAPVDLKINYLRPLAADGGVATATGRVLHSGRRVTVATAEVVDAAGRPVALATGSAMLLPGRAVALSPPRL
jgi:uncharacterized protein (TIGR00369 family)